MALERHIVKKEAALELILLAMAQVKSPFLPRGSAKDPGGLFRSFSAGSARRPLAEDARRVSSMPLQVACTD